VRQIVSLVKDGRVQYALVDEDTGELTEFAQVLVPDSFGLNESAHLGMNLIEATGLNGRVRRAAPKQALPPVDQPELTPAEQPERRETARERRNRLAREKYHTRQGRRPADVERYPSGRAKANPANAVEFYIPKEDVLGVVNRHPEGIHSGDIARGLWDKFGHAGEDVPRWVRRTVENRLSYWKIALKDRSEPLPFRTSQEPVPNKDGTPSKLFRVLYHPLTGET